MNDSEPTRLEGEGDDDGQDAASERPTQPAGDGADPLTASESLESVLDTGALLGGARGEGAHPETIGSYRILGVLGQGGMGVVYRAFQEKPVKRPVALKLIQAGRDTREIVARFESERQALALMSHPGIAHIYDAGTTPDHRPYFAMEFVEGVPITAYCEAEGLDVRRRLELFVKVCDAIQYAHQKAIIHRDLKPANILVAEVDGEPVPKVIDFGIAKAVDQQLTENTLQTQVGQIMGTLEYMSPEQTGFDEVDIDTRTDVYSLGVILYELVTDSLPFDSERIRREGLAGFIHMICEEDPPRPSTRITRRPSGALDLKRRRASTSRLRAVRGDLDWITLKALEKDRNRRYSSVSELAADVRRHLALEPILARPPSTAYRFIKYARRHRGRMIALAALVVISCAFVAGSWLRALHRTRGLLATGESLLRDYAEARKDPSRYETWVALREKYDKLVPVWNRQDEIEARRAWEAHLRNLNQRYETARGTLMSALELVPWRSGLERSIKEAGERLDVELLRDVRDRGFVRMGEAEVVQRIRGWGIGRFASEIEGGGGVELTIDPPGAEVCCYRYELHEEHLVPIRFRLAEASAGGDAPTSAGPFLRIERVFDTTGRSPFRAGDRVLSVAGKDVSTRSDFVGALRGLSVGETVGIHVERDDEPIEITWMPYATEEARGDALRASTIRDAYDLMFEGYPLELGEDARIATGADGTVHLDLPGGSYLLVLTKPGYATTRYPVAMPEDGGAHEVRMLREEEVPEGFIHVPAGRFTAGGDDAAYRGLPRDRAAWADGFLMARTEVTVRDYLEFLNTTELPIALSTQKTKQGELTSAKYACAVSDLRAAGEVEGLPEAVLALRQRGLSHVIMVPLVADQAGRSMWLYVHRDGAWQYNRSVKGLSPDFPVQGVSLLAALEYCHWMRKKHGGRWRFRLPRGLEWEKAARGVDGRPYVWGDHLYWTFCTTTEALPVGLFPLDESVYGIRDLAGSVSELIAERAFENNMFFLRGGNFNVTDERDFRAASRDQTLFYQQFEHIGFRLVADPPERAASPGGE